MTFTLLISGSRAFRSLDAVEAFVRSLPEGLVLMHGGAAGVDRAADRAARARGLEVVVVPAQWDVHGRAAGPIRNRWMVERSDFVVAFWDGASRGTLSTIDAARALGKPCEVFLDDVDLADPPAFV